MVEPLISLAPRMRMLVNGGEDACINGTPMIPIHRQTLSDIAEHLDAALAEVPTVPVPLILNCPSCGERHIDEGEFATKAHHTHACQACGMVWRPALGPSVGVRFLPGFKNGSTR